MHRWLILLLAAALVSGCQAKPRTSASASVPQEIAVLTTQTEVYTCPHCGMDYDRAGQCPMCKVDLVRSRIDYICPADHRPVERSGKCPRCAANALVQRTALGPKPGRTPAGN